MSINNLPIKDLWQKFTPANKQKFLGWRILYLVVVGALVAGGILTVGFIYQNIYATLSNAYTIMVLSSDLGVDTVDVNTFEKTKKIIEDRKNGAIWLKNTRNVFEYGAVVTTTPPTTTKKL